MDQFAAIALHNAGEVLQRMGRIDEAIASLERAAKYWSTLPTNPFADNVILVVTALLAGRPEQARAVALEAVRQTEPWPRPLAFARFGLAAVHAYEGRFGAALAELPDDHELRSVTGRLHPVFAATRAEFLFLSGASAEEIQTAASDILRSPQDQRYAADTLVGRAIATHVAGDCAGRCASYLTQAREAAAHGGPIPTLISRVKIGSLLLEHRGRREVVAAWDAVSEAAEAGLAPYLRWWLRRYAAAVSSSNRRSGAANIVAKLLELDPEGWRQAATQLLPSAKGYDRQVLLEAVVRTANRGTVAWLKAIAGDDVAEARKKLMYVQAARLYVRTFGAVSVHRGSWTGPEVRLDKKRVRTLLGVLAAHCDMPLTRDAAIDLLWPEADGDSAVNSLNQTVFQLRRYLDPSYRGGESPEYVISNADHIALHEDLVHTDLQEIRRLADRVAGSGWTQRHVATSRVLDLLAGEFISDLRYEAWAGPLQMSVHNEVRRCLLPVAQAGEETYSTQTAMRAAETLLKLDPYDEAAVIALASALTASGRRVAARDLIVDYVGRLRSELDDEPSAQFVSAAGQLGSSLDVKLDLTQVSAEP